jgi:tRNA A37 threonylcarbamoyladenosine synthetase subunit TsaC/SUA5/YrdC
MSSNSSDSNARVFTYTENNIHILCDSFVATSGDNKPRPLITPTYTTYSLVAPISSSDTFDQWLNRTNHFAPSSIMLYHSTHIPTIAKLTIDESEIIQYLSSHFWTSEMKYDELSFMVPPKEYIHSVFRQPNGKIIIDHSNHPVLQKLQETTQSPIAVQPVYVNQIPCTSYGHFEYQYQSDPVNILKQEEPCKRGSESTVIDIDTDTKTITVVRMGTVRIHDIIESLEDSPFSNYNVTLSTTPSKFIRVIKPLWNRRIYRTKWVSYPMEPAQIDELTKSTKSYLSNAIFVDFGKHNTEMSSIAWGYVDLTEYGEALHATYTFYDILHQLSRMNSIHPILFYDSYGTIDGYAASILMKLWNIESSEEEMYLPYECITKLFNKQSLYHEKTAEEREQCMEEVD